VLFTVLALAPGDPFEELATNPNVPPEVRMQLRANLGLDDPVWQRYWHWLTSMLKGDWGFSFISRLDVDTLIWQRLPSSGSASMPIKPCRIEPAANIVPAGSSSNSLPHRWLSSGSRNRLDSPHASVGAAIGAERLPEVAGNLRQQRRRHGRHQAHQCCQEL
jgi:hypothetical protein